MRRRDDVNKLLRDLYEEKWDDYIEIRNNNKIADLAYPYLIHVSEDYNTESIVVLVYGKEAKTWGEHEYGDNASVGKMMDLYNRYINIDTKKGGRYWKFMGDLRERCKNNKCAQVSFVFNNLFKMGSKNTPVNKPSIYNFEIELMKKEIEIIAPDIILFLGSASANKYNKRMKSLVGSDRKEKSLGGELHNIYEHVLLKEIELPLIYSTYNPCYRYFEEELTLNFFAEKINNFNKK